MTTGDLRPVRPRATSNERALAVARRIGTETVGVNGGSGHAADSPIGRLQGQRYWPPRRA